MHSEDAFSVEADSNLDVNWKNSDSESKAGHSNKVSDSSAGLRSCQKICGQILLEHTREIKEDWSDQHGKHAFDVGQMLELQGFRDRVYLNVCHVILDTYANISNH